MTFKLHKDFIMAVSKLCEVANTFNCYVASYSISYCYARKIQMFVVRGRVNSTLR